MSYNTFGHMFRVTTWGESHGPALGATVGAGKQAAVVESVKAAEDVYSPISGEVVAVNESLGDRPEQVNSNPYSAWFFKLRPSALSGGAW